MYKPSELYIRTPFHIMIELKTDVADSIYAPKKDTIDVFQIIDIQQKEKIVDDLKNTQLDIKAIGLEVGEHEFPELEFTVKNKSEKKTLKTDNFVLFIKSVITDSSKTVKPIADPLKVKLGFWDYAFPVIILIILVFIILLLKKYFKKSQTEKTTETIKKDTRPAYVICLEMLEKLKEENLLEKGDFPEFYFRLSMILRTFIERYYHINAVEMTTTEIRRNLKNIDHKEKSLILEKLSAADMVKFAKHIPKTEKARDFLTWLENYLLSFEKARFEENKVGKNA